jgi:hypothetical protein
MRGAEHAGVGTAFRLTNRTGPLGQFRLIGDARPAHDLKHLIRAKANDLAIPLKVEGRIVFGQQSDIGGLHSPGKAKGKNGGNTGYKFHPGASFSLLFWSAAYLIKLKEKFPKVPNAACSSFAF